MRDLKKEELLEVGFKESYNTDGKTIFLRLTDDCSDTAYFLRWCESTPKIILIDLFVPNLVKTMSEDEFLKGYITIPENAIKRYREIMKKLGIEE